MTLAEAIQEYKESGEPFWSHPEAISSWAPSPEFKAISDRYFKAREDLVEVTKESNDPRAQRWHKAFVAASENPSLMLSKEANETLEGCERIVDLCAERMEELKEAEEELLGCEF
jgi:ketopantoate reductase